MMTMSKPLSAGQAQRYHAEQFRDAGENYFTEGHEIRGEWDGRLAAEWGLAGEVSEEQFARLAEGQHPLTGEVLVKAQTPHLHTNARGETVRTVEHRAAWDLTLSAPKSVSLTALVGGDERVREAHRQAVDAALRATEPYVQARLGGLRPAQTTGQWVAARFEHDSARPVDGYSAPQLHTHTVVFNMTTTEDGQTRALQPRELYRSQQYATAVYRSTLATQLRALGYEIERGGSGQPEIRGYSPEYLEASSPRRQQIETYLDENGHRGAAAAQIAAHQTRAAKADVPHHEMRRIHRDLAAAFDHQPSRVVARATSPDPVEQTAAAAERGAAMRQQAVTFAMHRNIERNAVPHERDYLRDALSRSMGDATVQDIHQEFERQVRAGQFVRVPQRAGTPGRAFTTPAMIALETQTIAAMREGKETQPALIREDTRLAIAREYPHLTDDQRAAIDEIVANRDRVQALEGVAGAGKTTTLAVVRDVAERDGYAVKGLAPTGRAAQKLAEAGMPARTLQRHLTQKQPPMDSRRLYVLDESSLASTTQMHAFLTRLEPHDRVLLVGDARQHQAVDAGRPYEQQQEAGIAVARLVDIKRQQDPRLKAIVEQLARGDVRRAVGQLEAQGRVHEIVDRRARLGAVAQAYVAQPEGTLVVSPDNQSREELNATIHRALQAAGHVAHEEQRARVLVPRQDLTGADRQWAGRYAPGDVVRYARGSATHGLDAGEYVRVAASDASTNTVTVTRENGAAVSYDPRRLQGVSVYRETERAFAVGDRVQFTAPFQEQHVANRELGTVECIGARREVRVALDSGRTATFRLDEHRHLDHGYAVTSHSSQGQTADRVILVLGSERSGERLVNQRLAYVALSRGRHDASIYTDDQARLADTLSRDVSHPSAIEPRRNPEVFATEPARRQATRYGRNPAPTVQRTAADLQAAGNLRRDVLELNGGPTRSYNGTPTDPPASRGFSDTELQEARAYLRLPASRAYLRERHETDNVPSGEPARQLPTRLEPRHVAAVLRRVQVERGTSPESVRTIEQPPAVILRAAEVEARAEHGVGTGQGVDSGIRVSEHSRHTSTGHAAGQSHS